jgi:DNA-binding NarL/FixJ family response regulator
MTKNPIRLLIAEDHTILMEGYQSLFGNIDDISIVDVATNYYEVIHKLKTCSCDVLMLDLSMPMSYNNKQTRLSGLDVLEYIKKEKVPVQTLVTSTHRDYEIIKSVTMLGARGYVFKNISYPELLLAIRAVSGRQDYFQKEVEEILASKQVDEDRILAEGIRLSPRDRQILKLLSDGMKSEDIAELLGLGRYTVEEYRNKLIKKFNAKNTTHLVKKACDYKIL